MKRWIQKIKGEAKSVDRRHVSHDEDAPNHRGRAFF